MGDRKRLRDELAKHIGETVLIGVRSSFFFIGPCEEAISDLEMLGLMSRCCVALSSGKSIEKIAKAFSSRPDDIGERMVSRTSVRSFSGNEETVIIIEGKEFGSYWTRAEYLAGRQALIAELSALKEQESKEATSRESASV